MSKKPWKEMSEEEKVRVISRQRLGRFKRQYLGWKEGYKKRPVIRSTTTPGTEAIKQFLKEQGENPLSFIKGMKDWEEERKKAKKEYYKDWYYQKQIRKGELSLGIGVGVGVGDSEESFLKEGRKFIKVPINREKVQTVLNLMKSAKQEERERGSEMYQELHEYEKALVTEYYYIWKDKREGRRCIVCGRVIKKDTSKANLLRILPQMEMREVVVWEGSNLLAKRWGGEDEVSLAHISCCEREIEKRMEKRGE